MPICLCQHLGESAPRHTALVPDLARVSLHIMASFAILPTAVRLPSASIKRIIFLPSFLPPSPTFIPLHRFVRSSYTVDMKSAPIASAAAATFLVVISPVLAQDSASSSDAKPAFVVSKSRTLFRNLASQADHISPLQPTKIKAPFIEQFTQNWSQRWFPSAATKEQSGGEKFAYDGRWVVEEPTVFPGLAGDSGLVAKSKAAQHAISAQFDAAIDPAAAGAKGQPLVVQYEVKLQNGLSCGGAYLKLLTESPEGIQAKEFSDKTPYTIMFGPDKVSCVNLTLLTQTAY